MWKPSYLLVELQNNFRKALIFFSYRNICVLYLLYHLRTGLICRLTYFSEEHKISCLKWSWVSGISSGCWQKEPMQILKIIQTWMFKFLWVFFFVNCGIFGILLRSTHITDYVLFSNMAHWIHTIRDKRQATQNSHSFLLLHAVIVSAFVHSSWRGKK
jgi:hypothetical protein